MSIWNDPWLPLPYNFKPFSLPIIGTENWKVGHIIDHENGAWVSIMVNELFTDIEAEIILRIPLSLRALADRENIFSSFQKKNFPIYMHYVLVIESIFLNLLY